MPKDAVITVPVYAIWRVDSRLGMKIRSAPATTYVFSSISAAKEELDELSHNEVDAHSFRSFEELETNKGFPAVKVTDKESYMEILFYIEILHLWESDEDHQ